MKGYFKSPPFFITVAILVFVGIVFYFGRDKYYVEYTNAEEIEIQNRWELSKPLEEISGIAYMGNNKMACIQDEDGVIFIYNLSSRKIEKEITFAENDDFEGITLIGKTAYVLRSDGMIFEVQDFETGPSEVLRHDFDKSFKYDFEGLCYDKNNNRLLVAAKENGPGSENDFKPVFEFNLGSKEFNKTPVYKLRFDNPLFLNLESAGDQDVFRTSEIGIHPQTNDIYMLDGVIGKVMILNEKWENDRMYILNPSDFPQPEGLTFTPEGKLYVSNESDWDPANIIEFKIKEPTDSLDTQPYAGEKTKEKKPAF